MPQLLSEDEFNNQFGGGFRATPERAGKSGLFGAAMDDTAALALGVGEAAGLPVGGLRRGMQAQADATRGRYYQETGAPRSFSETNGASDVVEWGTNMAIGSIPAMAAIAGGGLVGGVPGAFAAGSAYGIGDVLANQRDQAGETNLATAVPLGVAYGAMDSMLGVGGMLARRSVGTGIRALDTAGVNLLDGLSGMKGVAARTGATALKTAGVESIGETSQEGLNQLGRMSVDPDETFYNERSAENFKESAIGGGLLGGLLGGAAGGWRRSQGYVAPLDETQERNLLTGMVGPSPELNGPVPQQNWLPSDMEGPAPELRGPREVPNWLPAMDGPAPEQVGPPAFEQQTAPIIVDPNGIAATGPNALETLGEDPGLVMARERAVAQQQQAQELQAEAQRQQAEKARIESFGVTAKGDNHKLYQELEALRDEGTITPAQFTENAAKIVGETPVDRNGARRFVRDVVKAQQPKPKPETTRPAYVPTAAEVAQQADTDNAPKVAAVTPEGKRTFQVKPAAPVAPVAPKEDFRTRYRAANTEISALRAERKKLVVPKDATGNAIKGAEAELGDFGDVDATSPQGKRIAEIDNRIRAVLPPVADIRAQVENVLSMRDQTSDGKSRPRDPVLQRRLSAVTGIVMGENGLEQPATPLTMTEVARQEGVSKQAISQQLQKHGLSDLHISRLVANELEAPTDTTANAMDENDATSDSASDQVTEQSIDDTSMRISSSAARATGDGIVGVGGADMTPEQRQAEAEATRLVKSLGKEAEAPPTEQDLAFEAKRKEAARVSSLRLLAAFVASPAGRYTAQDWNDNKTAQEPLFDELALELQEAWVREYQNHIEENGNDYDSIQRLQRDFARGIEPNLPAEDAVAQGGLDARGDGTGKRNAPAVRESRDAAPAADTQEVGAGGGTRTGNSSAALDRAGAVPGTAKNRIADGRGSPSNAGVLAATAPVVVTKKPRVVRDAQGRKINADVLGPGAAEAAAVNRDVTGPGIPNVAINSDVVDNSTPGEVTRFRKLATALPGTPPSFEEAKDTVQRIARRIGGRVRIEVRNTAVGATSVGKGETLPNGDIIIYADQAESRLDLLRTVFHELLHRGVKTLFKSNAAYVKSMLDLAQDNPVLVRYAQEWKDSDSGKEAREEFVDSGPLVGDNKANYEALAVEEAMARVAEELRADRNIGTRGMPATVRKIAAWVADLMDSVGAAPLAQFVRRMTYSKLEKYISETVDKAGDAVTQGTTALLGTGSEMTVNRGSGAKSAPLNDTAANFLELVKLKGSDYLVKFMLTKDLIGMASKVIPSAKKYLAAMDAVTVEKTKAERSVADIVESFSKLPKHEQGTGPLSVNKVLKDSTMSKTWAFVPDWLPAGSVKADPALAARFAQMSEPAQALVKRVFQHGHDSLTMLQKAVVDNTNSEYDAIIQELTKAGKLDEAKAETAKKAKSLSDFESLMAIRSGWPYAPLRRFGKHVVMAMSARYKQAKKDGNVKLMQELEKDGDHYYVAFAEGRMEAQRMVRDLKDSYPDGDVGTFEKLEQADAMMGGRDMLGAMRRLRRMAKESVEDKDLGEKTADRVDDMMRQLYLTLLSETSARKGEIHRKNIAGANEDMMRAFSTQGVATAHFIASLKTNGKIEDHLADMRTEVGATLSDRDEKQRYFNEIMRRHSMNLEFNPTPGIDKALSVSSVYLLLSNPSYFLMNATQPWMMSHPMMAGKFGYARSATALVQGYKDVMPILKDVQFDEKSYGKLPADVRDAIEALANKGVIQIELGQELGQFQSSPDDRLRHVALALGKLRGAAQGVETLNRLSTAIAAYRLEKQRTGSGEAAIDYAAQVINETHGDYTGFNAPRFMRTGLGRLTTQFRKFQLIQLSMFARLISRSFKGASQEERMAARYALGYNLAHLGAIGGVAALPGFTAAAWLVGKAFGDDEPDDPRATLTRAVGKDMADLLWGGATQAAGVPLGGRIGAGNMLSVLPYTDIEVSREGYSGILMGLTGPLIGGLLPRAYDGIGMVASGDLWKGAEALAPSGVANISKAVRFQVEGVTQRNGDQAMSPEDISYLDSALQAVGLPTNTIQERTYLAGAKFKADTFYKDRTSSLKKAYSEAFRDNDAEAMREVREEWQSTQVTRRELGFAVQPLSELLKAPQEQRKREAGMVGGVGSNKSTEGFLRTLQ